MPSSKWDIGILLVLYQRFNSVSILGRPTQELQNQGRKPREVREPDIFSQDKTVWLWFSTFRNHFIKSNN